MICIYRKYIYSKTELYIYIYFYIDNYIYDYIHVLYIIQVLNYHVLSSHLAFGPQSPKSTANQIQGQMFQIWGGKKKTTPCLQDRSMSPTTWSLHLKTAKVGILKSKKNYIQMDINGLIHPDKRIKLNEFCFAWQKRIQIPPSSEGLQIPLIISYHLYPSVMVVFHHWWHCHEAPSLFATFLRFPWATNPP